MVAPSHVQSVEDEVRRDLSVPETLQVAVHMLLQSERKATMRWQQRLPSDRGVQYVVKIIFSVNGKCCVFDPFQGTALFEPVNRLDPLPERHVLSITYSLAKSALQ